MATIHLAGDDAVTEEDAKSVRSYTPSAQELATEEPDEPDTPTDYDTEAAADRVLEPRADTLPTQQQTERAPAFLPPGTWVSPVARQRQRQALLLPGFGSINDLDRRIGAVMKFDGAPASVAELAQKARLAVGAAREAREDASHPDNPRYTKSVAAKDEVVKLIAKATTLVGQLERAAQDASEEWFASLTSGLDEKRAAALDALRAAERAYSAFRSTVNAAQALAIESGRWDKSWHTSTVSEVDLNKPIGAMRDAIKFLEGDDDLASGRFLTTEYEGIPPHTMANLKRRADVSQPGSFAHNLYARAKWPMEHDRDLQDAVQSRALLGFLNSAPLTAALMGRDPNGD